MKNTVLTITFEPDMLETSGLVQNVHITFSHVMYMVCSLRVRITFALRASEWRHSIRQFTMLLNFIAQYHLHYLRYHIHVFFYKYIYWMLKAAQSLVEIDPRSMRSSSTGQGHDHFAKSSFLERFICLSVCLSVCLLVCLSVCLSVCEQHNSKSCGHTSMRLGR